MPGFNLLNAQNNEEAAGHIVTVDDEGIQGDGLGASIIPQKSIAGQPRGLFHLVNGVVGDAPYEGMWDYLAFGVDLAANDDTKFRIGDLQPPITSVKVIGHIVGGTNDSTRVAGADFICNAYTTGATAPYYQIGEAFNGFIHKADNATYGGIFSDVQLYRTSNNYLGLQITNSTSIIATGCTLYLKVLMSLSN